MPHPSTVPDAVDSLLQADAEWLANRAAGVLEWVDREVDGGEAFLRTLDALPAPDAPDDRQLPKAVSFVRRYVNVGRRWAASARSWITTPLPSGPFTAVDLGAALTVEATAAGVAVAVHGAATVVTREAGLRDGLRRLFRALGAGPDQWEVSAEPAAAGVALTVRRAEGSSITPVTGLADSRVLREIDNPAGTAGWYKIAATLGIDRTYAGLAEAELPLVLLVPSDGAAPEVRQRALHQSQLLLLRAARHLDWVPRHPLAVLTGYAELLALLGTESAQATAYRSHFTAIDERYRVVRPGAPPTDMPSRQG